MLAPGHTIDRYVVESIIGTGGTAVVYRVRHRQLGTLHALKVLSVTSAAIKERMIREGRVQAALKHLNVVAVNDVLDIDGNPGLLLEYIEGPSLEDALRRYRLAVPDAEVLFQGVVAGVRHAHSHGLVHRDLKPANVLLARTPDGFVPKVTDFGLAKVLRGDGEGTGSTRTGIAMGTPHYMAPEQIRDARNVDQRADVFSLGCILYELVTGERTFPGDDALSIYNAIIAGEYVPPRTAAPSLPDRIDVAIRGALALDPARRIPDCSQLLDVLQGKLAWDAASTPVPIQRPNIPPPTPARQAPPETLPLAARGDDGSTPPPAPERIGPPRPSGGMATGGGLKSGAGLASGGLGVETSTEESPSGQRKALDSSEVSLAKARQATEKPALPSEPGNTLGGGEPLVMEATRPGLPPALPSRDDGRSWPIWALFAGSMVMLLLMVLVGGAIAAVAVVIVQLSAPVPTRSTAVDVPATLPVPATPPPATVAVPATVLTPAATGDTPTAASPSTGATDPVRATSGSASSSGASGTGTRVAKTAPADRPPPAATVTPPVMPDLVTVKLFSAPPTAKVKIDGKAVPGATPLKVGLSPGGHAVEITLGDETHAFPIDVKGGVDGRWCYDFGADAVIDGTCK